MAVGALDVSDDRDALERFLWWVNQWDLEWKLRLQTLISFLEYKYPAEGLWEIVKFK